MKCYICHKYIWPFQGKVRKLPWDNDIIHFEWSHYECAVKYLKEDLK